jgi:signal transduction histidine kinase
MRRRLILGVVSTVLLTGLLIGVPLVAWSDFGLRRSAQGNAEVSAQRTVAVVELRIAEGQPNDPETLAPYFVRDRRVSITYLDTGRTDVYGAIPGGRTVSATSVGENVAVEIIDPIASTGSSLLIAGRIAATTALAMLIAFLLSRRRAKRIADDFDRLAIDAARIGSGDTRPARRYEYSEFNEVASALDASSHRVQEMVRTERAFVSDVTHQLRTPLTAISLRLDEVSEAGDLQAARVEAAAAQEQVHRLGRVIEDLLLAARQREVERHPVSLDEVLDQQAAEWAPVFAAQGRRLQVPATTGLRVQASAGPLGQVLATLLENASVHGAGTVTLSVRTKGGSVVVEVGDQGEGIPDALSSRIFERRVSGASGSGLGLSLARALAEQMGARLELVNAHPAVFGVFLEPEEASFDDLMVDRPELSLGAVFDLVEASVPAPDLDDWQNSPDDRDDRHAEGDRSVGVEAVNAAGGVTTMRRAQES